MKLRALLAAVAAILLVGMTPASARPYEGGTWGLSSAPHGSITSSKGKKAGSYRAERRSQSRSSQYQSSSRSARVGGRPARWCGWWMRTQKGGGPEYNLAWNWRKYGSASGPQIGAVVVWRHHVGMITGRAANGQWIVTSGNDGGRVRSRARSVAGAIFRA